MSGAWWRPQATVGQLQSVLLILLAIVMAVAVSTCIRRSEEAHTIVYVLAGTINCGTFPSQAHARAFIDFYDGRDFFGLDRDGDGVVCEMLPEEAS